MNASEQSCQYLGGTTFTFDPTTGQCVDGSACPAGISVFKGGQCVDGNACQAGTTYDQTSNVGVCVSAQIPKPK